MPGANIRFQIFFQLNLGSRMSLSVTNQGSFGVLSVFLFELLDLQCMFFSDLDIFNRERCICSCCCRPTWSCSPACWSATRTPPGCRRSILSSGDISQGHGILKLFVPETTEFLLSVESEGNKRQADQHENMFNPSETWWPHYMMWSVDRGGHGTRAHNYDVS